MDYLLRAARAYVVADGRTEALHLRSNDRAYIDGALQCYHQAMDQLPDDSVTKAAVIREMKCIQPNSEATSSFASPSHRIHDLEVLATHNLYDEDFADALDKRTEIFDNILERRVSHLWCDLLARNEVTRLLLLLLLDLPPARQSPSHIKLLEQFRADRTTAALVAELQLSTKLVITLQELATASWDNDRAEACRVARELTSFSCITREQHFILEHLMAKYEY